MRNERNAVTPTDYCSCATPSGTHSCLNCGLAWGARGLLDDEDQHAQFPERPCQDRARLIRAGEEVSTKLTKTIHRRTNQFVRDLGLVRRMQTAPPEFCRLAPGEARLLASRLRRALAEWGPEKLGHAMGAELAGELVREMLDIQRSWVEEPLRLAREIERQGVQSLAPVVSGNNDPDEDPS